MAEYADGNLRHDLKNSEMPVNSATINCRLPITDYRLPITDYRLPIADSPTAPGMVARRLIEDTHGTGRDGQE